MHTTQVRQSYLLCTGNVNRLHNISLCDWLNSFTII